MVKEIDCRGLACPQPVIRCRDMLEKDAPDQLAVQVDNVAAVENVGRFLSGHGYKVKTTEIGSGEWRLEAIKDQATTLPESAPSEGKTLVLITTETLGRGDDSLGRALMENFLGTLQELRPALWRIVLLNGGVRLAASPGGALESLKKLASLGVGVFVCGTCLMHYGLADSKQVGETTNMLDIVTSLGVADKVIRP